MISNHFYTRYGLALVMQENSIDKIEDVSLPMLSSLIQTGLDHFRLQPRSNEINDVVSFQFAKEEFLTNNPIYISKHCDKGFFLSPNIITNDISSRNCWNALKKVKKRLNENSKLTKSEKATMSIMPMTSKFNNGKIYQSSPSVSLLEASLCLITTSTPFKPSLHLNEKKSYISTAIIPDLELKDLIVFIKIFKDMNRTQVSNMMKGKIKRTDNIITYKRPNLANGNFPNAPKRHELASVALLGAIGWWAKQSEYPNARAGEILEKLKERPLYIISYGKARSVTYHHYVVDLAKNNKLNAIIDAMGRISVYVADENNWKNIRQRRDNFFLFSSRFLQLFDQQSFREFISVRGEYPKELKILLLTYFRSVMKINQEIISSAASLGKWLNRISYFTAKENMKGRTSEGNQTNIRKLKAKILVELESAAFSAKSASSLVSQVITRAGRMSHQDAPNDSQPFIQAILAGRLGETEKESLENAKNMMVVFSRIRSSKEEIPIEPNSNNNSEIKLSEDEQE